MKGIYPILRAHASLNLLLRWARGTPTPTPSQDKRLLGGPIKPISRDGSAVGAVGFLM